MATVLDTRSQSTIVGNIAAGMQGRFANFLNFAVGSVLLALAESTAGVALFLQRMFAQILALTRASTSDGADLDSWMEDYDFFRLPARSSTGSVTFSVFSPKTSDTVIPVGAQVKTGDGSLIFTVYADPGNGAYSAARGGYVLGAGATAVSVPVACSTAGTVGNVTAGAINLSASSFPADVVMNPAAFSNGMDAESDPDFRTRFWDYIASLASGTEASIRAAIRNVQQGLRVNTSSTPGLVTVYVDDGSGSPPASLIALCRTAGATKVAGGVQMALFGATTLPAAVQMIVSIERGYVAADVVAQVTQALSVYINALPEGRPLRWARLDQIAFNSSPGVFNVTGVLLNGGTADLIPTQGQTVKIGTGGITVSPATS